MKAYKKIPIIVSISYFILFLYMVKKAGMMQMQTSGIISVADFYYIAMEKYIWIYLFIPIQMIITIYIIKANMNIQKVIRQKNKKQCYNYILRQAILSVFIQAVIVTCMVYIIGKSLAADDINWTYENSLYMIYTSQKSNVALAVVILRFNIIFVLKSIIIILFTTFFYWQKGISACSIIGILILGVIEIFFEKIIIFHNYFKPDYLFLSNGNHMDLYFGYVGIYVIMAVIVENIFVDRRDFLNEG